MHFAAVKSVAQQNTQTIYNRAMKLNESRDVLAAWLEHLLVLSGGNMPTQRIDPRHRRRP